MQELGESYSPSDCKQSASLRPTNETECVKIYRTQSHSFQGPEGTDRCGSQATLNHIQKMETVRQSPLVWKKGYIIAIYKKGRKE